MSGSQICDWSTLRRDFAADLPQVQQGEIFDARSDYSFGKVTR
jgi:hypothetical protein